jgi:predicted site-specific integrase-resolvase
MQGSIGEVVVAYRDRLCRFGFELIELIIQKGGGSITVLNSLLYKSKEDELTEDLLAITHVFNSGKMGQRRYCNKKSQDKTLSESEAETDTEGMVRNVSLCV